MKRTIISIIFIIQILTSAGCVIHNKPIMDKKINPEDITLIKASLHFNENPNGGNEAKFIKDKQEISAFVKAFQVADIGKEVEPIYGNRAVFRFYSDESLIQEISIYDFKSTFYFNNGVCFGCSFSGDNPIELYNQSVAETVFINSDFNVVNK